MLLTKQLLAFRPSKLDLIFACKTFLAAMVSLYISFCLDLIYPMWAIGTVFIIASPYSGMVSSKAIYRLLGTFVGASVAIFATPHLINAPMLLILLLALWVGFCLYISLLDRTPRSYMFMLSGYTSAMIAANVINLMDNNSTLTVFDIGFNRFLEISIAVVVTSVVFSTIFPLHLGDAVEKRVLKAIGDSRQIFLDLFNEEKSSKSAIELVSAINRDCNDIHGLAIHLAYENNKFKNMTKPLQELLHQFSLLLINLTSIAQRLEQLDQLDSQTRKALKPIVEQLTTYFQKVPDLSEPTPKSLPESIIILLEDLTAKTASRHAQIILQSLRMDMRHLYQNVFNVRYIWRMTQVGERKIPTFIEPLSTPYPSLHRDHGVALRGGIAATISILIGFGLWYFTGWQYGYMAAQMTAVIACILTALDNPIPVLKVFIRGTIYATIIVFIYLFFILPDVKAFWQLAVVLAPVMIYAVCLIPNQPLTALGLPIAINVIMALNLQNHYQISPAISIDAALAGIVGPIIPVLILYYIRAMSPDMAVSRLLSSHYRAMRKSMNIPFQSVDFKIHIRSMIDRIGIMDTKPVQSTKIKGLINEALIETSALVDLARLNEIAQNPEMPQSISSKIEQLRNLFTNEFRTLEKKSLSTDVNAEPIFLLMNDLIRDGIDLQNRDLQTRLFISINNIRNSICHTSWKEYHRDQVLKENNNE